MTGFSCALGIFASSGGMIVSMPYETVTELDQLIDRVKSYNADADVGSGAQGL